MCITYLQTYLVLIKFHFHYRDSKKIITNKYVGHMLRTKLSHVNEGGVAAGLGALDSVLIT